MKILTKHMNNNTYIIVDTANTFFRARHVINGDADIKLGMAFHITLNSIKKAWQDFNGTHVVFCLEGRSWSKDHYAPYKLNRTETGAAHAEKEAEEEKADGIVAAQMLRDRIGPERSDSMSSR